MPKKRFVKQLALCTLVLAACHMLPAVGNGKPKTADTVKKPVADAIAIRQSTQKKLDKWEDEKLTLLQLYIQLKQEHNRMSQENLRLSAQKKALEKNRQALKDQIAETKEIRENLAPFLETVYQRLELLVSTDPPFLKEERSNRLARLSQVLADPLIPMAQKYQKTMEALFIEAEYGNTIEVYQDKIRLGQEAVLGEIFRLGRVSLFFLSLDETFAALFNIETQSWQKLDPRHLAAVRSARDIGTKRKSAELLPLPLGTLSPPQGEQE